MSMPNAGKTIHLDYLRNQTAVYKIQNAFYTILVKSDVS